VYAPVAVQEIQDLENGMKKYLKVGVVFLALCAVFGTATAGTEEVSESRTIDARVTRVKIDGVIDLKVRMGAVPGLTLTGERKLLDKTTTVQTGDTLNIGTEMRGIKIHNNSVGLRAELVVPQLREVSSESVGWTDVQGFTGDELDLSLEGAGSMKINCSYRLINANLGGVGSMNIQGGNNDGIDLNLRGAGYVTLAGKSKWLKANLGGLGGLDAQHFYVDSVNLELSGLGNASVTARQNASLVLSGMGSVTVYGKPLNRQVSVDGLGKVSWK
jgi:hypothetical protein